MRRPLAGRGAWVLALWLGACGGAGSARPATRVPPRVSAARDGEPARTTAVPSRGERVATERAAAAASGAQIVAERAMRRDATLHLVLEAERCYRVFVAGDADSVAARLIDEHGHEIAAAEGDAVARLEDLCPRWSGSFELTVDGAPATVLLERVP